MIWDMPCNRTSLLSAQIDPGSIVITTKGLLPVNAFKEQSRKLVPFNKLPSQIGTLESALTEQLKLTEPIARCEVSKSNYLRDSSKSEL